MTITMELLQKKIAIPVDENNILDNHFGHCKYFAVFKAEANKIEVLEKLTPPPHEPGLLPQWLKEQNITDVIAGGLGHKAIELLKTNNISVVVGADKKNANDLANEYIKGELQASGNACNH